MAANRKKAKQKIVPQQPWYLLHLPKILAGLLATGAAGGTGLSMTTADKSNERVAVVETKIVAHEKDIEKLDKKVDRVDRRTVRMEETLKNIGEKLGVKQKPREYGPTEQ